MKTGLIFDEQICGPQTPRKPALLGTSTTSDILGPGRMSRCMAVAIRGVFSSSSTQGVVDVEACHEQTFTNPITIGQMTFVSANEAVHFPVPAEYLGSFIRLKPSTAVDGAGFAAWASGRR